MNEGDNFGTANGGAAPQGNNTNNQSFDPPKETVSSTPSSEESGEIPTVSTAGVSNSSKYFGARGRRSSRSQHPDQQVNFAAAQNIASNPNTPQFFSEAVMADNPYPTETPRKSKTPLFIGIAAAVVLLVVVIVIAVIPKGDGGGAGGDGKETAMEATFNSQDVTNINKMESLYRQMIREEIRGSDFAAQDFHEQIEKGTTSYRNVLNAIKNNEKQLKKEDKDADIDGVIAKMEKNVGIFEENYKQYDAFYKALENEKEDTISEISDESIKKLAKSYYNHYVSYQKTRKEFRSAGCKGAETELSTSERQICDAYEDRLDEDETAMKNSTLMKKLFIGDDEGTISDNYVKDSITEIYLKIRNSGVKNEDENKENS
ncbi:hypothetical protein IKQ38_03560 [Candidatus Saccharibacteria bacterium]|nr:hypothetical protein [Candidatus Saccharibacteria bacterium]